MRFAYDARIEGVAGEWLAVGDLDGDGAPDLATGRPAAGGDERGETYVFGVHAATTGDAFATVTGATVGEGLGLSGAIPGDLDGDGVDDLALGGAGGPVILAGPLSGPMTRTDAFATIDGGTRFAGLDHDGDGDVDLAVSEWQASVVHLLAGPLTAGPIARDAAAVATIRGVDESWLGGALQNVGDLDGDGAEDLMVDATGADTAGGWPGSVYLFLGPIAGVLDAEADADTIVYPTDVGLEGGLSPATDLDGDGHGDLVLGADGALVFAGPLARGALTAADATAIVTPPDYSRCGRGVDASSDLDGDGADDLVLGCPSYSRASSARLYYGPLSGTYTEGDATFEDWGYYDRFGAVVTGLGDINGDGVDDVGFADADSGGPSPDVYLFFGGAL